MKRRPAESSTVLAPAARSITSTLISLTISAAVLTACGGGGGGGASAKGTSSPGINESNEKQVLAAVMTAKGAGDTNLTRGGEGSSSSSVEITRQSAGPSHATRALQPVDDACQSGRMLIDDVTGEEVYDNCVWTLGERSLRFDGSILTEDLRADATSAFDTRVSYNDYSIAALISPTDHITTVLNGVALDATTDTGGNAEVDLRFTSSFACRGVNREHTGEITLESSFETDGDESSYVENGEMSFSGYDAFSGTLTVTTLEPTRYRDGYNDNEAYDGRIRIAAADGSAIEIRYAVGGLYVNDEFYTWAQYQDLFVVDPALAPCLTP